MGTDNGYIVCLVGGFASFTFPELWPFSYWTRPRSVRTYQPKLGPVSSLDDRVSELVTQLYNQDNVVYTHRTRTTRGYIEKRRKSTGTVPVLQPPFRLIGHSAGCTVIARMIALMAVHRVWMLRHGGEDATEEEAAMFVRTLPPDMCSPSGPVFIGDDGKPLDVRPDHVRSVGYISAPCHGVPFMEQMGYTQGRIQTASLAWFVWAAVFLYAQVERRLPYLCTFVDPYIQQMEGFTEGVTTGLILREFEPVRASNIFRVASTVLKSIDVKPRTVVTVASSNVWGYHMVLPRPTMNLAALPFYYVLALWFGLSTVPNDGVAPVASLRGDVQCSSCESSPWTDGVCTACGTIYSRHNHVSVLMDPDVLEKLME